MLTRHLTRIRRPFAVLQTVALLAWVLGSAIWLYAPDSAKCPMQSMLGSAAIAATMSADHACCQSPQTGEESPAKPSPGQHKGACCCPLVSPALPDLGLLMVPMIRADYQNEFAEPLMLDRLAARELVIPPSA